MVPAIPYVVGQWVRGERFYGREPQITEVFYGGRAALWLAGTRRIGKTSLLRQLELEASSDEQGLVPVVWDLQGATDAGELQLSLFDALLDAEEALVAAGIDAEAQAQEHGGAPAIIETLRRRLAAAGRSLLLLCDEAEELIGLGRDDPQLLKELGRVLAGGDGLKVVLTSSVRLGVLASGTAPFLQGFLPPLFLGPLAAADADALIRQDQLGAGSRPHLGCDDVIAIRERCGNHPYLLQILCKRFLELGDVAAAAEQIAADRMVSHFFRIDFDLLASAEQEVLLQLADGATRLHDEVLPELDRLRALGLVRRHDDGRLRPGSWFLQRWLASHRDGSS